MTSNLFFSPVMGKQFMFGTRPIMSLGSRDPSYVPKYPPSYYNEPMMRREKSIEMREEESKPWSGGMVACFVIIGIIVLALLILIILAVALPSSAWRRNGSQDNVPMPSPVNVVAYPSPAAVISGMKNVYANNPQPVITHQKLAGSTETMNVGVPKGTNTRDMPVEVFALYPASKAPISLNTMGSQIPAQGGSVVPSDSEESVDATFASHTGMPYLPSGTSLNHVTESLEINPSQYYEIDNEVFQSTARGLHHTKMAVGNSQYHDGPTVRVVSGAAGPVAPSQHTGQSAGPVAPNGHKASNYDPSMHFLSKPEDMMRAMDYMLKTNGVITLVMSTCPHCHNIKKMHSDRNDIVFVEVRALHAAHAQNKLLEHVFSIAKKCQGFPASIVCKDGKMSEPVMGAMPIDQIRQQAKFE